MATVALLALRPAPDVDVRNGVFQAITGGSTMLGIAWFGILAALLVTVGNAGGIGATVAGIARVPFVAGVDRYLPSYFGDIHPKWKTPWISILIQAGISAIVLIAANINTTLAKGYQFLVDMSVILYFIPFLYMYAAVIKLAARPDRSANRQAVLIPGGKIGVWAAGLLGFIVTLGSMGLAMIPPADSNKPLFEFYIVASTAGMIGIGLLLYWNGARRKRSA